MKAVHFLMFSQIENRVVLQSMHAKLMNRFNDLDREGGETEARVRDFRNRDSTVLFLQGGVDPFLDK